MCKGSSTHNHAGVVLDRGWWYDLEVWFFDTFLVGGRIGALRKTVLDLARLERGQSLLDVGCGTGTLAIAAAGRVGPAGLVAGVDPGARQLARARAKARRSGVTIDLRPAGIQDLPFPDASFDAATSTLMLHHLPEQARERGLDEMLRVLKPAGRLVVADFDRPDRDLAAAPDLPDLLARRGCLDVAGQAIRFPRPHRGWSGATVVAATKGEASER